MMAEDSEVDSLFSLPTVDTSAHKWMQTDFSGLNFPLHLLDLKLHGFIDVLVEESCVLKHKVFQCMLALGAVPRRTVDHSLVSTLPCRRIIPHFDTLIIYVYNLVNI